MRSAGSRWRSRWPRASHRSRCSSGLALWRRAAGALVVGLAYLVAVYLVQGAFKETIEALFVLAFAIGLGELAREHATSGRVRAAAGAAARPARDRQPSTPTASRGCSGSAARSPSGRPSSSGSPGVAAVPAPRVRGRPALPAAPRPRLLVVAIAPEIGRMVDFANFETFNPAGDGLGNLFNRLSPLEALGIWPSGDFRVDPATARFRRSRSTRAAPPGWRRSPGASPVAAPRGAGGARGARRCAALWLYALLGGTPYQEAKALC